MKFCLAVGGLVLALGGSAQARTLPRPVESRVIDAGLTVGVWAPGKYAVVHTPYRCPRPNVGVYRCGLTIKYWVGPHTPDTCRASVFASRNSWEVAEQGTCSWLPTEPQPQPPPPQPCPYCVP